jgi:hypothetical protein
VVGGPRAARRLRVDAPVLREPRELAVKRRQALLGDLALVGPLDLRLEPRTEPVGRELLSAPAHPARDVRGLHAELYAVEIDPAHDHVDMGVCGDEVVDRCPLDAAPEIALDAAHEAPGVGGEIEVAAILGRHDEPELMALADARLLEDFARDGAVPPVEHSGRTVLLDAVTLDVSQVPSGPLGAVAREALDVRLDDDATRAALGRKAVGRLRDPGAPRSPGASPAMPVAHQATDDERAGGDAVAGTQVFSHSGA